MPSLEISKAQPDPIPSGTALGVTFATSLGMQRSFGKWRRTMTCSSQAEEPGSPMERNLGCRMRQLSHPGSIFGTVKT